MVRKSTKRINAYVFSFANGVVQIGNTMYQPATNNKWRAKGKPWLMNDYTHDLMGIVKTTTSEKSMDGATEALMRAYSKRMG